MDTPIILEKQSRSFWERLFLGWIPEGVSSSLWLWGSLPAFLLLFTLWIGSVQPCAFLPSLPLFVFLGSFACLLWRTIGLSLFYGALTLFVFLYYDRVSPADRLWQMGIVFGLALDCFILLLSLEEIENLLKSLSSTVQGTSTELQLARKDLSHLQKTHQEEVETLQETIEKLKAEAEQRKIDRQNDLEKLEWVQSEIEMLTHQKETFIQEARHARQMALERKEQMEKMEERLQHTQAAQGEVEHHLTSYQDKIVAFHIEKRELLSNCNAWQRGKEKTQSRLETLEQALHDSKETIVSLEKEALAAQPLSADQETAMELARQVNCYKQLRSQFEEKSTTLSQTRKELFHTQEKLLAVAKENEIHLQETERQQASELKSLVTQAAREIEKLEEEIMSLEELVFHILNQ